MSRNGFPVRWRLNLVPLLYLRSCALLCVKNRRTAVHYQRQILRRNGDVIRRVTRPRPRYGSRFSDRPTLAELAQRIVQLVQRILKRSGQRNASGVPISLFRRRGQRVSSSEPAAVAVSARLRWRRQYSFLRSNSGTPRSQVVKESRLRDRVHRGQQTCCICFFPQAVATKRFERAKAWHSARREYSAHRFRRTNPVTSLN